ncbi:MAG: hypothetical protein M3N93_06820 [Acidobacteriota bacterium]|nr:hypothetical protein [Acidobacteriota bacterium]
MAPDEETPHLGLKFCEEAILRFAPRIEDDGPLRTQCSQFQADGFAHAPFDAIAHHRFAEGFGRGKADMRVGRIWFGQRKSGKIRTRVPHALVVDFTEFARSKQPDTFRKARSRSALRAIFLS